MSDIVSSLPTLDKSDGVDGSAAPSTAMQIAGKDGNGNLQTILTDTTGRVIVRDGVGLTPASPSSATVGVASGSILAANTNRTGLIIQNNSINRISLNVVGGAAVLNSGITLYPGGVWNMDPYSFTTSAVFAISAAASSSISIQEFS